VKLNIINTIKCFFLIKKKIILQPDRMMGAGVAFFNCFEVFYKLLGPDAVRMF